MSFLFLLLLIHSFHNLLPISLNLLEISGGGTVRFSVKALAEDIQWFRSERRTSSELESYEVGSLERRSVANSKKCLVCKLRSVEHVIVTYNRLNLPGLACSKHIGRHHAGYREGKVSASCEQVLTVATEERVYGSVANGLMHFDSRSSHVNLLQNI